MSQTTPMIGNNRHSISNYFREYEVIASNTARARGIDNQVYDQDVRDNAIALAVNVLDKVREQFGPISPNSSFRSEELEKVIANSGYRNWCARNGRAINDDSWHDYFVRKQHPKGAAADIEIAGVSNDDLYYWIKENLVFDQLIREFRKSDDPRSGWVHVSFDRHGNNRMQAFHIG